MLWLFLAFLARFFFAGTNAAEQLFSRFHAAQPIRCATVLYFCGMLPYALLSLYVSEAPVQASPVFLGLLIVASVTGVAALFPFYKCLQTDDAHSVVPFFEFTPVLLVVLAFVFLGETLNTWQALGGFLVILCGFLFSWDFERGHIRLRTLGLMLLSSLCYAIYQLCLRRMSDYADAWSVSGNVLLLQSVVALGALMVLRTERQSIIETAQKTSGANIKLGLAVSFLSFAGNIALIKAFQLAPTTGHVAALSGAQPFFSFFIAAALGLTMTRHYAKVPFGRETKIKLLLLIGIFGGIYLLVMG